MTVANIHASIARALEPRAGEPRPRVSKTEAEHIVQAARQGAGPLSHQESITVAIFALGADDPEIVAMLGDAQVQVPDFGRPGIDYVIGDDAMAVFDQFFRRHWVPVRGSRDTIAEELQAQLLALGKPRGAPTEGPMFRLQVSHPSGKRYLGHIDANGGGFYLEDVGAGRRGESLFYGKYTLNGRVEIGRR